MRAGGRQVDAQPAGAEPAGADALSQDQPRSRRRSKRLFVDLFLEAHERAPKQIILDLDATDDPLHGHQEGRFFHGYYDCYCYLPLYVFCGRHLLAAKLRRSNIDAAAGAVEEVARIVGADPPPLAAGAHPAARRFRLRARGADGLVRGQRRATYLFGLARNDRLVAEIADELAAAAAREPAHRQAGAPLQGLQLDDAGAAGAAQRRVVAKAEWTQGEANPRFVVTSLSRARRPRPGYLYEKVYCARGEMENRIKECQLDLFADRTSTATMRANQLRLWFASMAYVLLCALRRIGLQHTQFAKATCGTIRLKLLKIGALVRDLSVRRIKSRWPRPAPTQHEFGLAHAWLANAGALTNQTAHSPHSRTKSRKPKRRSRTPAISPKTPFALEPEPSCRPSLRARSPLKPAV